MRPHRLAHGVRQDGAKRRGGDHQSEGGVGAEDNRDEAAHHGPTNNRGQGITDPAEPATRTTMVLGEGAQTPWTGGHLDVYRPQSW